MDTHNEAAVRLFGGTPKMVPNLDIPQRHFSMGYDVEVKGLPPPVLSVAQHWVSTDTEDTSIETAGPSQRGLHYGVDRGCQSSTSVVSIFADGQLRATIADGSFRAMEDLLTLQYWECDALKANCIEFFSEEFGPKVQEFGERLAAEMHKGKGGHGMAANQVGVIRRMFVMHVGGKDVIVCNPTIRAIGDRRTFENEGCLSAPGIYHPVSRPADIILTYKAPTGEPQTMKLQGLEAHVAQHELDHLNGLMFFSEPNLNRADRKSVLKTWKKLRQRLPLAARRNSR